MREMGLQRGLNNEVCRWRWRAGIAYDGGMAITACPACGGEMDSGRVQMRSDTGSQTAIVDLWFISQDDEDWLVVPSWEQKQAFRCVHCGTTVILQGQ